MKITVATHLKAGLNEFELWFPNEYPIDRSLCADGNFLNYHEEKRSDVEDWQLDQEKVKIISTK